MRRYSCPSCGNGVHFDNTMCVGCGGQLAYAPLADQMLGTTAEWRNGDQLLIPCVNRSLIGCNWLVADAASTACLSCRHSVIIPDLSAGDNIGRWAKLERAKRTLFYSLLKFNLLPPEQEPQAQRLRFELKADLLTQDGREARVLTGHENGLITINIAEADDAVREKHRVAMGEPYRTLIGHFRHEIGHYFWDRLIAGGGNLGGFRSLFGDERDDYGAALARYYQAGAPADWNFSFVSAYASSHPWEDFAETWAHYFHIVDGLETAGAYGIREDGSSAETAADGPYHELNFNRLIDRWIPLTVAMNEMNRSIGNSDFYPFVLSEVKQGKLAFIHALIRRRP